MNGIKPLSRSCHFLFSLHAGAFYNMTLVLHLTFWHHHHLGSNMIACHGTQGWVRSGHSWWGILDETKTLKLLKKLAKWWPTTMMRRNGFTFCLVPKYWCPFPHHGFRPFLHKKLIQRSVVNLLESEREGGTQSPLLPEKKQQGFPLLSMKVVRSKPSLWQPYIPLTYASNTIVYTHRWNLKVESEGQWARRRRRKGGTFFVSSPSP